MTEPKTNGDAVAKPELEPIKTDKDYLGIPNTSSPTALSPPDGVNIFDETIPHPEEVPHRNLVLCFDGTGDQFDADVSIYHLMSSAINSELSNHMARIPISSHFFQC